MVSHWPIPSVQPPLHSQSPYTNQNGNADACLVCGDWLVCCAYICSDEIRTAIIELGDGPLNSVDGPQVLFACPLNPHFAHSATHCVG